MQSARTCCRHSELAMQTTASVIIKDFENTSEHHDSDCETGKLTTSPSDLDRKAAETLPLSRVDLAGLACMARKLILSIRFDTELRGCACNNEVGVKPASVPNENTSRKRGRERLRRGSPDRRRVQFEIAPRSVRSPSQPKDRPRRTGPWRRQPH